MPKSSIETRTPNPFRLCRIAVAAPGLPTSTDSVISSSSRLPGRPVARSASRTAVTRLAEVNCTAETLTATLSPSGQRLASRQARCSTHSPSGTISPSCSATGMNSAGEIMPRVG